MHNPNCQNQQQNLWVDVLELWLGKKKWDYGYLFNKEWVNEYLP